MSMPRVPLPLAASEPRCSSDACPRTCQCARRRATVLQGSPMQDFSAEMAWVSNVCAGFVDLTSLHREDPPSAERKAKPWPSSEG